MSNLSLMFQFLFLTLNLITTLLEFNFIQAQSDTIIYVTLDSQTFTVTVNNLGYLG